VALENPPTAPERNGSVKRKRRAVNENGAAHADDLRMDVAHPTDRVGLISALDGAFVRRQERIRGSHAL